jgi:hypothetical protein
MDYMSILNAMYALILSIVAMPEVQLIAGHTFFNFVLAIAVAVSTAQFRPDKLVDVFGRKLFPLVLVYAASRIVGSVLAGAPAEAGFTAFAQAVGAILPLTSLLAIEALLFSDMVDSLAQIPGMARVVDSLPAPLVNMLLKQETRASVLSRAAMDKYRAQRV